MRDESLASGVRGGEMIRRVARRVRKFKGRDFLLWKLGSLLNRSWPREFPHTDGRGLRFFLDLNDPAYRALYLFGRYESDLLWAIDELLGEGDTFVEAGTSVGVYTVIAAQKVGANGRVFGFEPLGSSRATALRHSEANGFHHVRVNPFALGSAPKRAQIFEFAGLPTGHASLAPLAPMGIGQECEVITLDSFVDRERVTGIRLIKLDVEGSEFDALLGARATVQAQHPPVIVEANPETTAAFGHSFAEIRRWFRELGYDGYLWAGGRWTKMPAHRANDHSQNVLFVWDGDVAALERIRATGDSRPAAGR